MEGSEGEITVGIRNVYQSHDDFKFKKKQDLKSILTRPLDSEVIIGVDYKENKTRIL